MGVIIPREVVLVRTIIFVFSIIMISSIALAGISVGLDTLIVSSYFIEPDATPVSTVLVIGLDFQMDFARFFKVGLTTPIFGAFISDESDITPIPPGFLWYTYAGVKLPFRRFYAMADIGTVLAIGGFVPESKFLRVGGGFYFGPRKFVELATVAKLEELQESLGKIFTFKIGYQF
ncbi:MAG: hypothetical protein PWQ27_565 [Kosmotoga sp.]|jgi:hypothetical protein|nr:hypothetical protein [Kosmotoga sp.]MDK2953182.1 hypothetical protein [Kosmotoga sp.]